MSIPLHSKKGVLILTVTTLVSGLGFLMASAVTIALPIIQKALAADITNIQWIVNSYVLVLGSLILLSGALGDLFCAKRIFTIGIIAFTAGCALCGVSWNTLSLIGFRTVQGAGAALMVPGSLTVINRVFMQRERGRAIGIWAGISGGIAALGPFIGGVLADISWRWVFLALVPFGLISIIMAVLLIPHLPGREGARIDRLGAVLIFASLGALSYSFIMISERGLDPGILVWGIGGLIAVSAFVVQNRKTGNPLLPPDMFSRNVIIANIATFLLYFAFQGVFFLLAFRLQQLHGYSALEAGLALIPAIGLIALLTGPSGALTDRRGPRFQMSAGPFLVTAAIVWWVIFPEGDYPMDILPGVILLGAGMVLVIPPITKTALDVEEVYSGAASGLNNGASRVAGLFAVALAGSVLALVYTATLRQKLQIHDLSQNTVRHELSNADQLLSAPLPDTKEAELIIRLRQNAFEHGFFYSAILLGVASFSAGLVSFSGLSKQPDS
ncbi:MAG: MFS transporter [Chitinispirillaceae bacterium]